MTDKEREARQTPTAQRTKNENLAPVRSKEIAVYIQKSSIQFDDVIYFLSNVEPARFNFPKPGTLRLSDDAWAALQLRVDHAARNLLDPHRYGAASACVAVLIAVVFLSVRPGYDKRRIHATDNGEANALDDDEMYDDYLQDDLWARNHGLDDVVEAELEYLNSRLDRSMWIWRIGLLVSLAVLFGSVIFLAVLMERRNVKIDDHIREAIAEIRPRVEGEGYAVEYRSQHGARTCVGRYVRPTRVVVFRSLDGPSPVSADGAAHGARKAGSFFSEDYQKRYFPPRSTDDFGAAVATSTYSII